MSIEAGWYHAEGDPPGTVRRWNGSEWVGFAIAEPGSETAAPRVSNHAPLQGQVSLKVPAVTTQIALILLAIATISLAVSYFRFAADPGGLDFVEPEDVEESLATQFSLAFIASGLAGLFAAISFVVWFFLAYRNISLWHQTRRARAWAIFAWVLPFMNLIRPMSMMLELVEHSPRPDRQGRLSPTPVIAWWFLWTLPGIAATLLLFRTARARDVESIAQTLLFSQGVVMLLNVIAMIIGVYIVQGITDEQELRRR